MGRQRLEPGAHHVAFLSAHGFRALVTNYSCESVTVHTVIGCGAVVAASPLFKLTCVGYLSRRRQEKKNNWSLLLLTRHVLYIHTHANRTRVSNLMYRSRVFSYNECEVIAVHKKIRRPVTWQCALVERRTNHTTGGVATECHVDNVASNWSTCADHADLLSEHSFDKLL